ncbi:hypothetical protein U0035_17960 [Niabella yanshanensis]|uniref:Lipoprotein SmpA/OmlA domain-containing protein n=1 Tax=Niabella yanshanensis TaxID=577386 RepID=A0ABZ0W610_9BACT|nr:hypothetical protein [Niabella yanshanensis]WQD37560.1 hypothetical protein U0035_17960 [Niabella yanshanensis]
MKKLMVAALLSLALFSLLSCSVSKSAFDTTRIKAGMSKKAVIEQLGKPYKTEFFTNNYSEVIERLQYIKFVLGNPYEVHYLEFRNDKLISLTSPPPVSNQRDHHTNELQP